MCRSATDTVPASAFLTGGVANPYSGVVNMSMAKLLPFKQVTFLIPLILVTKLSFQFFTGAMEEEDEEDEAGQIQALCAFSQLVKVHARNLDTVATAALQAFLIVAAM